MEASNDPKVLAAQAAASAAIAADAATETVDAISGLSDEVRALRRALTEHPTHAEVKRARWLSIGAVLVIMMTGLVVVTVEANRANTVLQTAFLHSCEQRRELEAVLRGILAQASTRPDIGANAAEQREDRDFARAAIKALTSPPCAEVLPEIRPSPPIRS